jgi:hypothetical protein
MDTAADTFTQVILETGPDGRARFVERRVPLTEGTSMSRLSAVMPSGGLQLRRSPAGFASSMHCTTRPQWLFVLEGRMEIGLPDGSMRVFGPGQHFYSADTLPPGAVFDPAVHGHCSLALDDAPLVTAFVRS